MKSTKIKYKILLFAILGAILGGAFVINPHSVLANCTQSAGDCADIVTFGTSATTLNSSGDATGGSDQTTQMCNDGSDFILGIEWDSSPIGSTNAQWWITNSGGATVLTGSTPFVLTQTGESQIPCDPSTTFKAYEYSWNVSNVNISSLPAGNYTFFIYTQDASGDSRPFAKVNPNGAVVVNTNNSGSTWSFPSSASNPCGACSGTSQTYGSVPAGTYNFSPTRLYATTVSSSSSGSGGSTCPSGSSCVLAGGGQVNFNASYTNTTCTVTIKGWLNSTTAAATNQSFTISGPTTVNASNTAATQTFTVPSDQTGSSYSFAVNSPASRTTVNGYAADYGGVSPTSPQSCTPGQNITFTINYKTSAVLQVQ